MAVDVLEFVSSARYPQLHLNGEACKGKLSKYLSFVPLNIVAGQLKVSVTILY